MTVESQGTIADSVPSFCKIAFHLSDNKVIGFKNPASAYAKLAWSPSRFRNTKTYKRQKVISFAYQYNFHPVIMDFLATLGCDLTNYKQHKM